MLHYRTTRFAREFDKEALAKMTLAVDLHDLANRASLDLRFAVRGFEYDDEIPHLRH